MSESPIVTFIRGFILLAILLALPGIAICWNHLPKDLWNESEPSTPKAETTFRDDPIESAHAVPAFASEPMTPELPPLTVQTAATNNTADVPPPQVALVQDMPVQQVSWDYSPSVPPPMIPPQAATPQDFESLKRHLDALGATFYELKKWGNRGELFRFSCLVAPSESHVYKKHFQAIAADEMTAIQTVIAEIEQWKNAR